MHGRSIIVVGILAALALPASAHAGVAQVRETTQGRGNYRVDYVAYDGGDARNVVTAQMTKDGVVTLTDSAGVTPGPGCTLASAADPTTVRCVLASHAFNAFVVALGGGDDRFTLRNSPTTNATVDGGSGNDVLRAGDAFGVITHEGADVTDEEDVTAGATLHGGPGDDTLIGGKAQDTFDEGTAANGSDTISGGGDFFSDTVDYSGRRLGLRADLAHPKRHDSGEAGEHDTITGVERVLGGHGDDRLVADNRGDVLEGGPGNDVLIGGRGIDYLVAGRDEETHDSRTHDRLTGGAGDDTLEGSAGANVIKPGPGRDTIDADAGDDAIVARDGSADTIDCYLGHDRVALDAVDSIGAGCERIDRQGAPRATAVKFDDYLDPDEPHSLDAWIACPYDAGRTCRVRVVLSLHGRLLGRGASTIRRDDTGRPDPVAIALTPLGKRIVSRAAHELPGTGTRRPVRVRVTTLLPGGGTRVMSLTEHLGSQQFG